MNKKNQGLLPKKHLATPITPGEETGVKIVTATAMAAVISSNFS